MKNFIKFQIVVLATLISVSYAYAQKSLTKDININGCIQIGSNYAELLGIKNSENFAIYTEFSVFHKTGVGVAYYAYDDFSEEETGRVRFIDLAYANQWGDFSMYAATEYGWYDNWAEGKWLMEYAICGYSLGTWALEVTPMLTYFPNFSEDQYEIMIYGKVTKTFLNDWDVYGTVWYDNVYQGFYGAVGTKFHFPHKFYLGGILLYKDDNIGPMASFGWRF